MRFLRKTEPAVAAAILSIVIMLIIGTVSYRYLEKWTWIQAFYFSVVTLTTVGYGDLYPTSETSRLFTALFLLSGAAVVLASLTAIGSALLARREERITGRRSRSEEGEEP